jgi:hypothetical protein
MSLELKQLLANDKVNGWGLFYLIALPVSVAMVIAMARTDLATGEGVSSLIQLSVRLAVPWLYLAFAASACQQLFPGLWTRWLLRNRKIMGLCFALAMAWQLLFIIWLVTVHSDYYVAEVYVLRDAIEGVLGYLFLLAMTLTSFRFGRKRLSSRAWKRLHTAGIYFLWAYAWSVYWYELFYYEGPQWIDYCYYWAGFAAWGLRVAAWSAKRHGMAGKRPMEDTEPAVTVSAKAGISARIMQRRFGSSCGRQPNCR